MAGGGKGGSGKVRVNQYYLSIHYGICHGPGVFKSISYKDKIIWQGSIGTPTFVDVDLPNLFGGPKEEGGVGGRIYFLPGTPDQVAPAPLAAKYGATPETCPAYRGLMSLFFTGTVASLYGGDYPHDPNAYLLGVALENHYGFVSNGGFYWSANNPFLEGIKVTVECIHDHLGATHSIIEALP